MSFLVVVIFVFIVYNLFMCLPVYSGGIHSKKGKTCEAVEAKIKKIEDLVEKEKSSLFPEALSVASFPYSRERLPRANGGWGDLRDRSLCLNFTANFTHL